MTKELTDKLEILEMTDFKIYISKINGKQMIVHNDDAEFYSDQNKLLNDYNMFTDIDYDGYTDIDSLKSVTLSINSSSQCNMACKYCFKKERPNSEVSYEKATAFIELIINKFSDAEKYYVDLSGFGEPLLRLDFILQVNDYCKQKSDEINKEIIVMLVTNGLLLTESISNKLAQSGILFGVSIDGDKIQHDVNRVDITGNGTYERIISNIKEIQKNDYVGAAVSLSGANNDLIGIIKSLIQYFPTISMKPVRDAKKGIANFDELLLSYEKLVEFLLTRIMKNDYKYIFAIINGDDYFGKFFLRAVLDISVITRCDAGIGRFSLVHNGDIYGCPAGTEIDDLKVGSLESGINDAQRQKLFQLQVERANCKDCCSRFICGGECLVLSNQKNTNTYSLDNQMCILKRHLFKLAILLKNYLFIYNEEALNILYKKCFEIIIRGNEDIDLKNTLGTIGGDWTFTKLKKLKNEDYNTYLELQKAK